MKTEEGRILNTLTSVESVSGLSQRTLARRLGVALGTTNKLVQHLVKKKWVKLSHKSGRTSYQLTSAGLTEKLRLQKLRRKETLDDYVEICNCISASLETLNKRQRRLVFYGAGDVAHIVYTRVAHSTFELVGVVDDQKAGQQFFEHKIAHPSQLKDGNLNSVSFEVVVVASYNHADEIEEKVRRMNFPPEQILVLFD